MRIACCLTVSFETVQRRNSTQYLYILCLHSMFLYIFYSSRATFLTFWKTSNGHISTTGHPIHFMFGSMVGFTRSADRMDLRTSGWTKSKIRPPTIFENFE